MDNWLKSQKELRKSELQKTLSATLEKNNKNRHFKNNAFSMQAKSRIESWVHDNELMKSMIEPLKNGSVPLMHVQNYQHRQRNKFLERDPKGVLMKNYMTAKDRASLTESKNKEFIMDRDDYNPNLPFKSQYLRERDPAKDVNYPMRFGVHPRLENTKIIEEIQKKSIIDHHAREMKMVHFPDWKETRKEKWVGNQTFMTRNCNYTGKRSFLPWAEIPSFLDDNREKYIDGYETMGDLSRKRDKSQEFKRDEFISIVGGDVWNQTLQASNSWRTKRTDEVFRVKTDFDEYSKNDKQITYKNNLINTQSIDHMMPFPHSNNVRGTSLRDFRPTYQKIYNQSIKEYLNSKESTNFSSLGAKIPSIADGQNMEIPQNKLSVKNQAIIEERDSPMSTNSSTLRNLKKKKEMLFLSKEDKIKIAVTKSFGGLA